jgi:hypothetical protein
MAVVGRRGGGADEAIAENRGKKGGTWQLRQYGWQYEAFPPRVRPPYSFTV